ncbi:hypothetical protein FH972_011105 [Carpinus fangiana]|uniref:Uncharacterized protein n=1 Tax=Carpinus fangiana TaxID=176857 RepID=A0A660KS47_9ROSI|nr:hypothetical protein FH972_011105 [Carpinus fangiana]
MRNIQIRKKELVKHIGLASADQTNELGKRLNHCNTTELIACGILREQGKIWRKVKVESPHRILPCEAVKTLNSSCASKLNWKYVAPRRKNQHQRVVGKEEFKHKWRYVS